MNRAIYLNGRFATELEEISNTNNKYSTLEAGPERRAG
jgi:hypothetical protein